MFIKKLIMRFLILILLLLSAPLFSQNGNIKDDSAFIKKANTAKEISYLLPEEKSVIFYLNVLRSDPKFFLEHYLQQYLDSTKENDPYTKTLIKTLANTERMILLQPQKDLSLIAKTHAIKCGKDGIVGHGNFKERFHSVNDKYKGNVAENCDYGNHSALQIVMVLLIDEGIKDLGHRKNILNPRYKNVGISIQPHKRYKQNCVMDFGG
jgi:uncharacterized protein YkwD